MAEEVGQRKASKKIRAVIDRIEDNEMAVVQVGEDGKYAIDWPTALLPKGATDGDHLNITITLDAASRAAAEDNVKALQERLLQRSGHENKKDFKL